MGFSCGNCSSQVKDLLPSIFDCCCNRTAALKMLHKLKSSGHLVKWSVELTEYDVSYQSRAVTKAQTVADFVVQYMKRGKEVFKVAGNGELIMVGDYTSKASLAIIDGSSRD